MNLTLSSPPCIQSAQQLAQKDVTIQRLQRERDYLQEKFDTLRRESLSPHFPRHQPQPEAAPVVAAGAEVENMEVDEPDRKRKRLSAPRQQKGGQVAPEVPPFTFGGPAAPMTADDGGRRVVLSAGRTMPPNVAAVAAGGSAGLEVPTNLSRMTIAEMKSWLTDNGFESDVFELNNKKAKKGDWVTLIQDKCQ
jgi:hypothetical protein